ncbi:MAG TPA: N-acetylmuramoyl-L-alanine amidase [Gammaproteobacteria bacterium]|nr:N-acetylmuramoyl-L-alanine amidase [Gammaproteobacteria bacterium]
MKKLILLLCWLPLAAYAGTAQIEDIDVGSHEGFVRVTLDVSAPVEHKIFTLKNPNRVVLDIESAKLDAKLPSGRGLIADFRSGRHGHGVRIVFDLNGHGVPRSFFIPARNGQAARLVVDVYGDQNSTAAPTPIAVSMPSQAAKPRDIVIAVDAGHGGFDPGAHGPDGLLEKDVTLAIAKKLAALIDAMPGMRAVLTRKDDRYLKLRQRTGIARAHHADMFVSIHANASRDDDAFGGAVFALSQHGATSEAAHWLANRENDADNLGGVSLDDKSPMLASVLLDLSQTATISASLKVAHDVLDQMGSFEPLHSERVEQAAFVVLKSPDIPSILVETAFITNPHQERLLRHSSYQERMATAILNGVMKYYEQHPPPGTLIAARDGKLGGRQYVINHGDTLSGIADRFDVSLQALQAINGLSSSAIHAGDVLTIPAG